MIIQINETCRLQSDTYNWAIQVGKGDAWTGRLFFRYFDQAVRECVEAKEQFATAVEMAPFAELVKLVEATDADLLTLEALGVERRAIDPLLREFAIALGLFKPNHAGAIGWTFMSLEGGALELFHSALRQASELAELTEICAKTTAAAQLLRTPGEKQPR